MLFRYRDRESACCLDTETGSPYVAHYVLVRLALILQRSTDSYQLSSPGIQLFDDNGHVLVEEHTMCYSRSILSGPSYMPERHK